MRILFNSFLAIIALAVVVSCCSSESTPSTVPESAQIIAEVTNTPQTTSRPELSATPTPAPIPTNTISQDQSSSVEDLPPWMSDENTSKFIIQFGDIIDLYKYLGIINAETGEIYKPQVDNIQGYFWLPDGQYLGILLDSYTDVLLVNVQTGERSLVEIDNHAVEYVHFSIDLPGSLITNNNPIDSQNFRLFNSYSKISDDGKYLIKNDYEFTSIIDLDSGEIITVTNQDDGLFDQNSAWIPTTDHLSIIQTDYQPEHGYYIEEGMEPSFQLTVYDILRGEVINTIPGVPQANWSPDGNYLLYRPFYEGEETLLDSTPCILNTATNHNVCLKKTEISVVNELPGPVLYHSLSWSPSGKMFSFAYYSGEGSGLCLVEIDNLSERCMLADLYESGYHVAGSAWSPDENFIDFQFGQYPPYSIADFPPFHGVLNIITGEYFEIGETISESSWQP